MQVSIKVSYIVYLSDERKGPKRAKTKVLICKYHAYYDTYNDIPFFYVVTYVAFLLFDCVIFFDASIVEWDVNDIGTSHECFAYQCYDVVSIVCNFVRTSTRPSY